MKEEELDQLYTDCVEFWGAERQLRMLQEECAEVILEVSHYLRPDRTNLAKLIEEIADAQLMINQMKALFGEEKVKEMMDIKSDYIKKKLEEEKGEAQWNLK